MTSSARLRPFTGDRFVVCLLFIGIAVLACLMPAQNDTWWHLRAGYDMLQTRAVLLTDTFSHTVYGQPWPNYEWLTEVLFAAAHRVGGLPLLTACCAAAIVGGLALTFATTRGDVIERALLLAGVVAGSTLTWSLRPQAFTLLLLGATMYLTSRRCWWPLPPLFLLWANLHGAVALGGLVLAGTLLGHTWHERRVPRRLLLVTGLCAALTMVTPLGIDYWPEIVTSIRRSRMNDIAEWRPPSLPPSHLVFWSAGALLVCLGWFRRHRLEDAGAKGLVCSALLALVLAARSMRNISPFLMLAAPAISCLLPPARRVSGDRAADVPPGHAWFQAAGLVAAFLGGAVVIVGAWRNPPVRMGWRPMSNAAAGAIAACTGPIYNRYVDGGPLTFFVPGQPVLLDSRQDPYPASLVQAQFDVERTGAYEPLFNRYGIRCAVVPPGSRTRRSLVRDGWSTRFADKQWVVLERSAPNHRK